MQYVQRAPSCYWLLQLVSLALRVVLLVVVGTLVAAGTPAQAVAVGEDSQAHQRPGQARHRQYQQEHRERRRMFKERQQERRKQLRQRLRDRLTPHPATSAPLVTMVAWAPATTTTMVCSRA